jgi:hypothetical protein
MIALITEVLPKVSCEPRPGIDICMSCKKRNGTEPMTKGPECPAMG